MTPPRPTTRFKPGDAVRVIAGPAMGAVTVVTSELVLRRHLDGPRKGTAAWVHRLALAVPPGYGPGAFVGAEPHHLKPYREGDDPLALSLEAVLEGLKTTPSTTKEHA